MLKKREFERYQRQIAIPKLGREGQRRLKEAKVFVAGAGGLGSAASLYLAAAGIGKIRIIDKHRVKLNNLNRQILYSTRDIGRLKVEAAKKKLVKINPEVEIEPIAEEIGKDSLLGLIGDCGLIVDAMDNFPTRYLLNGVAIKNKIPFIHGAVEGFEGRVTTIIPKKTACLRCVYPKALPPSIVPILGATAGVIGCVQATEVIKYLTGIGQLLTNKLLIYDGEQMTFDLLKLERNPKCPACGSSSKGNYAGS
ncbi:MAG TPA: HesA/MoeB/ThiF family protein [Thermoplasmata archaeon]|nr:HesA/MoeB/ThiF family protein [Thermoplasmata archaeon]